MSAEQQKVNDRLIKEVWNQGNLDLLNELCDPNFLLHDGTTPIHGIEGFKRYIERDRLAFPDVHFAIEDQVVEGDKVVTRFLCRGTHEGYLLGIAPTGRHMLISGMVLNRFVNDKLVESWMNFDTFGMMRQLGVISITE